MALRISGQQATSREVDASETAERLRLRPVRFDEASRFIQANHTRLGPPRGWLFGVAVERDCRIVGVVTIGRPVARLLDDGRTAEVTRCCTDRTKHVASMLYAAAWRACKAMGYERLVTYALASEPGVSLKAAGWEKTSRVPGRDPRRIWTRPGRPKRTAHSEDRVRWEKRTTTASSEAIAGELCQPAGTKTRAGSESPSRAAAPQSRRRNA